MQNLLCIADAGVRHGCADKLANGVETYGSFSVYKADKLWQPQSLIALERAKWLPYCEKYATSPFLSESCNLLSLLAWLDERKWLVPDVCIHILTDSAFLSDSCYETYKQGPESTVKLSLHLKDAVAKARQKCPVSIIWIPGDLMKKTILRH